MYKLASTPLHDHVYRITGSPSSAMFEECVAPLIDENIDIIERSDLVKYNEKIRTKHNMKSGGCRAGQWSRLLQWHVLN
ncbi:hypothetical protein Fmac_009794 [Flemingia macrophylla]|uniref:Uncharacterized protein n=1 Tax=Flemingia macrophylla TaxID=520843 RepID=A0ABD1N180_9FABA